MAVFTNRGTFEGFGGNVGTSNLLQGGGDGRTEPWWPGWEHLSSITFEYLEAAVEAPPPPTFQSAWAIGSNVVIMPGSSNI